MMYRTIIAAAFAALASNAANAATVWIGNGFIEAVSGGSTCTSTFTVGDFGRMLFRPRGGPLGNGGDSNLVYVTNRSAFQMQVQNGDFQTGATLVNQSEGSTGKIGTGTNQVTSWSQGPAGTIGTGTETIKVVGKFTNFFRITNCNVTIRMHLLQR